MCKHCPDGEHMHYDYYGSDGLRHRGCAAYNWAMMGYHSCGCPGFEEKTSPKITADTP